MLNERVDKIIKSTYKRYCEFIDYIPEITEIKVMNGNYADMQFLPEDLYDQKYILYINQSVENERTQFIENTLWHEFTHIFDSITLKEYEYGKFKNIMMIYSEIHAAETQMNHMLRTQDMPPYTLDKNIEHGGFITLGKYMDTSLEHVTESFILPPWIVLPFDDVCNPKNLYYFIGYLKSLDENSIKYEYNYSGINEKYIDLFIELTEYILNNNIYDFDKLVEFHTKIKVITQTVTTEHNKSFES